MITVNLYADRMLQNQPTSADQIYYATREHSKLYSDAAQKLGLTRSEYDEFRKDLLNGKVTYVRIPAHLDGMAGQHHGNAYVLKNVNVIQRSMGWKVALSDGNKVYVPELCGNLSFLHGQAPVVAHHAAPHHQKVVAASHVAPPIQVSIAPPPAEPVPQVADEHVAYVPAVVPAAAVGSHALLFAPLLGLLLIGPGGNGVGPPPCSQGSNAFGVCQK
jgi:hypothetical protein